MGLGLYTPPTMESPICIIENLIGRGNGITLSRSDTSSIRKEFFDDYVSSNEYISTEYILGLNTKLSFNYDIVEEITYLGIVEEVLPDYFEENKIYLDKLYLVESQKYHENIVGVEEHAKKTFELLSNSLSELKFEAASVELTEEKTVKFILSFLDKKMLMVTKSILETETQLDKDEVIFSFFISRKLIASNVSKVQEFSRSFNEYLSL